MLTFEKFHLPQNRTGMEINKRNTEIQTKAKHTNKHKRRKCGLRKTHLIWSRVASSRRILESWSISVTSAGACWTAAMEIEMAAAGKRANCVAMENATKEQTACSGRTSTKATKEKRDNKKGVQQQAGVALTWMKKSLSDRMHPFEWKNLTVGCIHIDENSDRRLHPLDEKYGCRMDPRRWTLGSLTGRPTDRPTDRRMCHLDEPLKSLTGHILRHLDESLH